MLPLGLLPVASLPASSRIDFNFESPMSPRAGWNLEVKRDLGECIRLALHVPDFHVSLWNMKEMHENDNGFLLVRSDGSFT